MKQVFIILFLAIFFRLFIFIEFTPGCCASDEGIYHSIASHLFNGEGFIYTIDDDALNWTDVIYGAKPPFYPYFLSTIYKMFGINPTIARTVQVLLSVVTGLLVYYLGKELFDHKTGIISLLVFSLFWETAHMSIALLSENIYWPLLFVFMYLATKVKEEGRYSIFLGLVLSLLVLVRPPSITFIFPLLLYLLWGKHSKSSSLVSTFKKAIIVIAFAVLPLIPWTLRNYQVYDQFVFIYTDGGINLWMGNYPDSGGTYNPPRADIPGQIPKLDTTGVQREIERDNYYKDKAIQYIKQYPLEAIDTDIRKVFMTFSTYRPGVLNSASERGRGITLRPDSLGTDAFLHFIVSYQFAYFVTLFFLGVLIVFFQKKHSDKVVFVLILFIWSLGLVSISHTEPRYVTHLYPFMIFFVSVTVKTLTDCIVLKTGRSR